MGEYVGVAEGLAAGWKGFRWHSLRHTWASWLAQSGTPMNVLQEMGGWESPSMVRRYAHLSPAQFAGEAESIARFDSWHKIGTTVELQRMLAWTR